MWMCPNSKQPDAPLVLSTMELQFFTTVRGKPLLLCEAHQYTLRKVNKDESKVWQCVLQRQARCRGSISTCENVVLHGPSLHCHDTDVVKEQAKQVARKLKVAMCSQEGIHSAGSIWGTLRCARECSGSSA